RFDRGHAFHFARGGDTDELGRHLAHAAFHLGLARLPAGAAELVENDARLFRAVARQKLDILDGKKKLAAVILKFEAIMGRTRGVDRFEPKIAADAVLDVRDEIAGRERRNLLQKILRTTLARMGANHAVAQNVLLGNESEIGSLETMLDMQYRQR